MSEYLPSAEAVIRVLTLQDYNTRVVVLGTGLLGLAAGVIGTFMLLRKRALLGDALSHATLPGIALIFLFVTLAGGAGKSLAVLLSGAVITGVMGVGTILFLRHQTRLKEDAALGIVLSVFFGAGVAVLGVVQGMESGHAAGLESFIYGKTASMISSDAMLIGAAGLLVAVACTVLYKEFKLLCFDAGFAASQGSPVIWLDVLMMALVVTVTVIGLQAVGLILVIALLVIPPASARFWTDRMLPLLVAAALVGGIGAMLGAAASALVPRLPSGAMIVVTMTVVFLLSMVFGRARGVLPRYLEHRGLSRRILRQNLLRALYEWAEERSDGHEPLTPEQASGKAMPFGDLLAERSWSIKQLRQMLLRAKGKGLVEQVLGQDDWYLAPHGLEEARRVVRNHRLWETFLIHFADVAPSHVDRDADAIEHVLEPVMIERLERLLGEEHLPPMPGSPHAVAAGGRGADRRGGVSA